MLLKRKIINKTTKMNPKIKHKIEEEALRRFPVEMRINSGCTDCGLGQGDEEEDVNEHERCLFIEAAEYGYNIKESVNEELVTQLELCKKFLKTYYQAFEKHSMVVGNVIDAIDKALSSASNESKKQSVDVDWNKLHEEFLIDCTNKINSTAGTTITNNTVHWMTPEQTFNWFKSKLSASNQENNEGEKWISVEDRLPNERDYVSCFLQYEDKERTKKKPCVKTGWLKYAAGDKSCPFFVVPHQEHEYDLKWKVTHWMPLPNPPKEK